MSFGHEKLDVYRAAIEYVGWGSRYSDEYGAGRNDTDTDPDADGNGAGNQDALDRGRGRNRYRDRKDRHELRS